MSHKNTVPFGIIHGDSAVELGKFPSRCIDLTITSPPYDDLRTYNGYSFRFKTIARELYRVTKFGGVLVWVVNDSTLNGSETGTSFKQALFFKKCGFNLHDTMVWDKEMFTAVGALKTRYAPVFEYMFVFAKGKPKTFNPIKDRVNKRGGAVFTGTITQADGSRRPVSGVGKKVVAKFGQRHNVWRLPPEMSNLKRTHPAMFPEALARDHLLSWSNKGDVVLDPFLGSGTVGKVARKARRLFVGIDISLAYCHLASRRIFSKEFSRREPT